MPTTYVLRAATKDIYTMVVHTATPAGNNSAGVPWSTCIVNTGLNGNVMTVGTGPGLLPQADADAIQAGTLLQASFVYCDDPNMTNPQRIAAIQTQANRCITDLQAYLAATLKWFGQTVPTS